MAKQRFELWGETLRDLGILILVFVPLDCFVEYMKEPSLFIHKWHLGMVVSGFVILGVALIVAGVEIERR